MSKRKVEELDNIEIYKFFQKEDEKLPKLFVLGGIHGNEKNGVIGARLIIKFFEQNTSKLSNLILEKSNLLVVPVLNVVGYLANARGCPSKGQQVEFDSSDNKVVIPENQKGGMRMPEGWNDPNRGWENNTTLAKNHVEDLLKMNPDMIIFNHDWANPQGSINSYCDDVTFENIKGVANVFSMFYPTRTIFGTPFQFVNRATKEDNGEYLSMKILEKFNVPSFVVESYLFGHSSSQVQFCVSLYLLAKRCKLEIEDKELIQLIMKESNKIC